MARQQGTVVERDWKTGPGFALRFTAYGKRQYVTLGPKDEGWTRALAEEELSNVMADVRRGIWAPPAPRRVTAAATSNADDIPAFGYFARTWLAARKGEVSGNTTDFFDWALDYHLLPYFDEWLLTEIDIAAVDAYRGHMVEKSEARRRAIARNRPFLDAAGRPLRPLSASSINKTIDVLQAVLALAVEYYDKIATNAAAGRRRRLKPEPRIPAHLETVDQVIALLDAAQQLDREPAQRIRDREANVAGLLLAGFRAHEHCGTRWRHVDLKNGRIHVRKSKTQAGLRDITILPLLERKLDAHRERSSRRDPGDLVYPTNRGTVRDKDNLRNRVVAPVFTRASDLLVAAGLPPLPDGLTPHKLRHAFASIRAACGAGPVTLMTELGHTDAAFSMRVYTHPMARTPEERARLRALVYCEPIDDDN